MRNSPDRRKVVVIGGLGFIGSRLVELLTAWGHKVRVLDSLTYAGCTANLRPELLWHWHRCDLNDGEWLVHHLRDFRPDVVMNLAAESHVTRSLESQKAFVQTNVAGVQTLLSCCLDHWQDQGRPDGFRLLQASTDEVYGSLGVVEKPWTEDSPVRPNNPYAASKAAGEMLAMAMHRTFGLPVVVTRGCNVFGPRQHPEKAVPTFCRQVFSGEPVTLHGDGQHSREWLYVDDHCAGLWAAAANGRPGQAYNLAGGSCMTTRRLARMVANAAGQALAKVNYVPDRHGNDWRYESLPLKAEHELGWHADENFLQRLQETVAWYRAAYERRYQDGYGI